MVGDAGLGDAPEREIALLARQRDGGDVGAALRGLDGELAPAGTDLQHRAARSHRGEIQDGVDLATLRAGEIITDLEHGRGVTQRLVEERREQVVGQVVVAMDVLPRLRRRALLARWLAPLDKPPESLHGLRDQRRHVAGKRSE